MILTRKPWEGRISQWVNRMKLPAEKQLKVIFTRVTSTRDLIKKKGCGEPHTLVAWVRFTYG
jgi:hypothetical protein